MPISLSLAAHDLRPKGPTVHIAQAIGLGEATKKNLFGPTGQSFICNTNGWPVGLKICTVGRCPQAVGLVYTNGWPFWADLVIAEETYSSSSSPPAFTTWFS